MPSPPLTEADLKLDGGEWVTRGLIQVWVPGSSVSGQPDVFDMTKPYACIDCTVEIDRRSTRCKACHNTQQAARLKAHPNIPQKPIDHGTPGGYTAHRRRGVPMCEPCREARRVADRKRQYDECGCGGEKAKAATRCKTCTTIRNRQIRIEQKEAA